MRVIIMNDIVQELDKWGVPSRLEYDPMGDGWIILAGNNHEEFLIHHGFEYGDVIYADVERLLVEPLTAQLKLIPSVRYLIGNARLHWLIKNKAFDFNQKVTASCGQF